MGREVRCERVKESAENTLGNALEVFRDFLFSGEAQFWMATQFFMATLGSL
jgi:hypothetical protein